jgi:putative transposase
VPSERWEEGGFLPRMPESLEQLDLLLMQEARARKVRRDGIHFHGLRYLSLTLAAYVGEDVIIRFDPRDMGEIRVSTKIASFAGGLSGTGRRDDSLARHRSRAQSTSTRTQLDPPRSATDSRFTPSTEEGCYSQGDPWLFSDRSP